MSILAVVYALGVAVTFVGNIYRVFGIFGGRRSPEFTRYMLDSGALALGMAVVWPFEWVMIAMMFKNRGTEEAAADDPSCRTRPIARLQADEHRQFCSKLYAALGAAANKFNLESGHPNDPAAAISSAHVLVAMAWAQYVTAYEEQGHQRSCARANFLRLASGYTEHNTLPLGAAPPSPET